MLPTVSAMLSGLENRLSLSHPMGPEWRRGAGIAAMGLLRTKAVAALLI
jgi:hypothetical protein